MIRLRPDAYQRYAQLHREVWPEVLAMISTCHIRNYTIFHRDGLLLAYMEYHGDDLDADMARMAADPVTQRWWTLTDPLQEPLADAAPGEWWSPTDEVFHHD